MIIGLYSSKPQSGKSTVALEFSLKGFYRVSFASPVKDSLLLVLRSLGVNHPVDYLWGNKKNDVIPELGVTSGYLMSTYATTYFRDTINQDIWLNCAKKTIGELERLGVEDFIFDDMRFKNEYDYVDIRIKVIRPGNSDHTRSRNSEGQLDNLNFDYTIVNDGSLYDLENKVNEVIKDIKNDI